MNARRAHSKSKNGCSACRTRKVKCDEKIPCLRCVRRGDECSLVQPSTSGPAVPLSTRSQSTSIATEYHGSRKDDIFTLTDLKLFHHFTNKTCRYMANPVESSPWFEALPALALEHSFLLHELMALAAVDLSGALSLSSVSSASISEEETRTHLELASRHHAQALAGLMPAIASRSADLVAPVWACNSLLVPYYFSTASDAASLLFATDPPGPAAWMLPLRGSVALFQTHEATLLSGPIGAHLRPYQKSVSVGKRAMPHNASDSHVARMMARLLAPERTGDRADEDVIVVPEEDKPALAGALKLLREGFATSDEGDALGRKTAVLTFCAFAPARFFEQLAQGRQAALVAMAFWCLLLHRTSRDTWWLHVRSNPVRHLLEYINSKLDPDFRDMIDWPIQEIGLPGSTDES